MFMCTKVCAQTLQYVVALLSISMQMRKSRNIETKLKVETTLHKLNPLLVQTHSVNDYGYTNIDRQMFLERMHYTLKCAGYTDRK